MGDCFMRMAVVWPKMPSFPNHPNLSITISLICRLSQVGWRRGAGGDLCISKSSLRQALHFPNIPVTPTHCSPLIENICSH